MAKVSWIDIVEAAYDVDGDETGWLRGILAASEPLMDDGFGLFSFTYDASTPDQMTIGGFARTSQHVHFDATSALAGIQAAGGGAYVRGTFQSLPVAGTRATPGFAGSEAERMFDAHGMGDLLVVNGVDPGGNGVCIGAITREHVRLSSSERGRYARVATHLANGRRLRRRLAASEPPPSTEWNADAVLTPRGRLEHARSADVMQPRDRDVLREAAVALDRARGRLRHVDPDSALAGWLGLVDGRWSLIDQFDSDGRRYVLACRNEPRTASVERLTERERTVASYAAMGHTNKLIAYDLGIAHSTVRVLLARAASKLGARSREALVAAMRESAAGGPGATEQGRSPGQTS